MTDPESAFRQQFSGWNYGRLEGNEGGGMMPPLTEWTDYLRAGANNMYNSLPTYNSQRATEEPSWFKLSRLERLIGFSACLVSSILCFAISFFMFPVLAMKPRKFGMLWSMGSLLFVVSFGVLQGPRHYIEHLLSRERFMFTIVFFGSVLTTIYVAMVMKSTLLTIFCSIIELFAIAYYTLSYFPFGALTLTWFSSYIVGYVGGFIGGIL